ncbi:hypothetical protein OUZ56_026212 [Daphnia magna]|uniref:Chromo domain-containing protein n=1 Tax=Daphnia magna TaxID=35525 RepID=A0ABQ9ZM37_9CRUS|nr:hypothetical protein OUZ56_026212 [Daphnia magna]
MGRFNQEKLPKVQISKNRSPHWFKPAQFILLIHQNFKNFKLKRVLKEGRGRKVQYLLKYVGYDASEWTNFKNCHCPRLIREYHRKERV